MTTKRLNLFFATLILACLSLFVLPLANDDYSLIFREAGRAFDAYGIQGYYYAGWNTWLLRLLGLIPRAVALLLIWSFSIGVVLTCAPRWDTPAWVVLVSPPFLVGMRYGHPFESMFLLGVTLIYQKKSHALVALGMALILFKPQLGAGVFAYSFLSGSWLPGICAGVSLAALHGLDMLRSGRAAIYPITPGAWPDGGLPFSGPSRWLWLVVGAWALTRKVDPQIKLLVAALLSMLLMDYFPLYALWPLVAMSGHLLNLTIEEKNDKIGVTNYKNSKDI